MTEDARHVFANVRTPPLTNDFRYILRLETRDAHDQLDRLVSTLDIGRASGFRTFLQMHLYCFSVMQQRISDDCRCGDTLADMIGGLRQDLSTLSARAVHLNATLPSGLDPLALDYMVAGSRLGTKVLSKAWAGAADPIVAQADGYFGLAYDSSLWPETCNALSLVPSDSARAGAILADTRTLFQFFTSVFQALTYDHEVPA